MKKHSRVLSTLIAAALCGGAYAQGAGAGGAGAASGEGAVPGGRSSAQDSTIAPTTGSSKSSSSTVPSAGSAYPAGSPGGTMPSGAPSYGGSMSSSGTGGAMGMATDAPASRADVQRDATDAIRNGRMPRGDALVTRNRPHGGPFNADAPTAPAAVPHTMDPAAMDQID